MYIHIYTYIYILMCCLIREWIDWAATQIGATYNNVAHSYATYRIHTWHASFIRDRPPLYVTCLIHTWHDWFLISHKQQHKWGRRIAMQLPIWLPQLHWWECCLALCRDTLQQYTATTHETHGNNTLQQHIWHLRMLPSVVPRHCAKKHCNNTRDTLQQYIATTHLTFENGAQRCAETLCKKTLQQHTRHAATIYCNNTSDIWECCPVLCRAVSTHLCCGRYIVCCCSVCLQCLVAVCCCNTRYFVELETTAAV